MRNRNYLYFEKDEAIPSPSGERYAKQYAVKRDGNNLNLVETGTIDTHELIQSYEDGVSLEKMIKRFNRGDTSAFSRRQGFYADTTGMCTDPAEVIRFGREAIKVANDMNVKASTDDTSVENLNIEKENVDNEQKE